MWLIYNKLKFTQQFLVDYFFVNCYYYKKWKGRVKMKNCFYGCDKLTELTFPSLEKIYCTGSNSAFSGTFYSNNKIQKMYFIRIENKPYTIIIDSYNTVYARCGNTYIPLEYIPEGDKVFKVLTEIL